ncbi:MAG: response regulator [Xanthomonadales bacterium]|nr:PIG-L family deacetylase [Gammaproteobacteria bacterium]MBT8052433.1 PIG-L family deacetylase [Gammaproteobacteria bacterium]NND55950.1 response regulator [Xanthomonadales bacterium]NNK50535.1 response regulator [Xanthomonadales bacterium]
MDHSILVIDDDDSFIRILKRWLKEAGYSKVRFAATGREALAALSEPWDVIVSDIYLPDMDGIEIAQRIKQRGLSSRLMLMTGHLTTEVALRALNHHVDAFLPKPFGRREFVEKVAQLAVQKSRGEPAAPRKRVLAVGAHPDDVEIGCGGILLNHRDNGDELCILTLSRGACGGTSSVREAEAKASCDMLGARLIMESLEDTRISEGPETISVISKVIAEFQPTVVYTHSPHDAHQDHRNAHRATLVAARGVQRLKCYQSPSATIGFTPSHFVDITEKLPEKQALLSCYRSQRDKCRYLSQSLINATAEYWGRFAGYVKVEPLEVIRSA